MDKTGHSASDAKPVAHTRVHQNRDSKKIWWISGVVILVVALLVASLLHLTRSQIDTNKYQAVFLSNGQVYFGKLHDYYSDRPYLTNVYYIQGSNSGENAQDAANNGNQQLVKLGSEVHAPTNTMILNKSSILFVENLTEEGNVMKLIKENESK